MRRADILTVAVMKQIGEANSGPRRSRSTHAARGEGRRAETTMPSIPAASGVITAVSQWVASPGLHGMQRRKRLVVCRRVEDGLCRIISTRSSNNNNNNNNNNIISNHSSTSRDIINQSQCLRCVPTPHRRTLMVVHLP